jgi:(p)ppGpp synthase/HD superfamily hydrolase
MLFAREAHKAQKRKYTGNPYADHLAEVAGIIAAADLPSTSTIISVAWLHDCVEDCGILPKTLMTHFGVNVTQGVIWLTDGHTGNRAARKAASRARLSAAPGWVQTIKVADLISNTASIVEHDPVFAKVYLAEKRLLLAVLTKADPRLVAMARAQIGD